MIPSTCDPESATAPAPGPGADPLPGPGAGTDTDTGDGTGTGTDTDTGDGTGTGTDTGDGTGTGTGTGSGEDTGPAGAPPPAPPCFGDPAPPRPAFVPLLVALATTVLVTAVSWLAPQKYSATLVGLAFLGVTWWMVLRHDEDTIRRHGLALGGLLEPLRIDPRRLLRDLGRALAVAAAFCVVVFPAYAVGFWAWWSPKRAFHLRPPPSIFDELTGQVLVIALPEEAFFRGYLQTAFDQVWPPRWKIFGAMLGPGWLLTALIFAVGHVLTNPNPGRMAVFFPALIFGWMRARTGGIGTGVAFHALCNLFSATLIRGYGMTVP